MRKKQRKALALALVGIMALIALVIITQDTTYVGESVKLAA